MRDDVGLELRKEFEDAAEVVEETIPAPANLRPNFPRAVMEKFHATELELANMATRYKGLKINGLADRAGFAVAHAARIELKDARILIDKTRKAETAEAQTYIKTCNAVAKYLTGIIAPAEDALDAEEAVYNAEVEAEKNRKQAEAAAKLQARIEELQKFGQPFTLAELTMMTDTQYGFLRATAEDAFNAREALRIEAEAALAKQKAEQEAKAESERKAKEEAEAAERARIAAQAAENAKAAAALEAERAKLKAEQDAFEAKQRAQAQAEREKQIAEEAAQKAKAKAEQDAKEAAEKAKREQAEEEARKKAAEAAKPDADKIRALSKVIREIGLPVMATDAGKTAMTKIEGWVARLAESIEKEANTISPVTLKAP